MSADGATPRPAPSRFDTLDGLRGLAALAVAALHALHIAGERTALPNAALAVDFFFGLSGFVVAHAYDGQLARGLSLAAFMRKRFNRLYPMIAFGVALGAVVWAWTHGQAAAAFVQMVEELLLLPTGLWRSTVPYPLNLPMWSLLFEILACLGYGVLARSALTRWLPGITALAGASLAAATLAHGDVVGFGTSAGLGFFAGGLRVAYPFLFGVLAYRLQWHARAFRLPTPLIGAALLAILLCPDRVAGLQVAAVIVLLPTVILLGARATTRMKRLWGVLGRLSYPLYIVHWPVLIAIREATGAQWSTGPAILVGVAGSMVVAWLALLAYDEPVRRMLACSMGHGSRPAAP